MTVYRCIMPQWALDENPQLKRVVEGQFTFEELLDLNEKNYNIYFLPNYPSLYEGGTVDGFQIDKFQYVFVDMDLKDGVYTSKDAFVKTILASGLVPTFINDSGNGIHAYWEISDLDAMSFLKLQRRLIAKFNTDEAVGQIYQLMRVAGTVNTKDPDNFKLCQQIYHSGLKFSCEDLDALLPPLSKQDEDYCHQHFNKTYKKETAAAIIDKIPLKFSKLLNENTEVRDIWAGKVDDRSKGDFRLAHIMFANGFTRDEAASVLVNSAKALARAPQHRISYATNILDKIWTFELEADKTQLTLSNSVMDILMRSGEDLKGTRFPCHRYIDDTANGFRLGQVVGLVAGSGVGKTAVALNMFLGFVKNNPDYVHFFVPLEQPAREIALRWKMLCGENTQLHSKVQVLSNYDDDGGFRHLSLDEIKQYILKFQTVSGQKVGCVVIDHIGALKKKGKNGENQDLMDICHSMKAFAIQTNTMLVMQSQAPREKAGVGDLELNKDAAYGTVYFESYCDYLITIWQPLKRCHSEEGCPTVTAFKFCKIRHKNQVLDNIKEDVCYRLLFDPESGRLSQLTENTEKAFDFFNNKAVNKRKGDRKTDIVSYVSAKTHGEGIIDERDIKDHQDSIGA